jgi:hypothetical protein
MLFTAALVEGIERRDGKQERTRQRLRDSRWSMCASVVDVRYDELRKMRDCVAGQQRGKEPPPILEHRPVLGESHCEEDEPDKKRPKENEERYAEG